MRPISLVMIVLVAAGAPPGACMADESAVQLRDAPGRQLVQANCMTCHSLDYIQMNSVFLDREGWQKSVDKMVKVMGAPIRAEDVAPIVDYLVAATAKNRHPRRPEPPRPAWRRLHTRTSAPRQQPISKAS